MSLKKTAMIKLSSEEQEPFGRIMAQGFMDRLNALSGGETFVKESKVGKFKKILTHPATLVAGTAGVAGTGGYAVGAKKQKDKDTETVKNYLRYLRAVGALNI